MDGNKKRGAVLILLASLCMSTAAQELELGIQHQLGVAHSQGVELAMNGWSMDALYLHKVADKGMAGAGLELGYTDWGSQSLLSLHYRHGHKHLWEVEFLNGMAFYQQGPHYVMGLGLNYAHRIFRGRNGLLLSAGLRFSMQPAYRDYSTHYAFFDLPLRISWNRKWAGD